MKLSILIPTLQEPRRILTLGRLLNVLCPQVDKFPGQVELQLHDAGRSMPTGTKRNELIKNSSGDYFCFIDDDDLVPEYYVQELMDAIEENPDVITFEGYMTTNGHNKQNFTIKLGSDYCEKDNHYYRYPNHLCCFRRERIAHVKFEPVWIAEDYRWATEIMKRNLLKTSVHIEKPMYHYDFVHNPRRRVK